MQPTPRCVPVLPSSLTPLNPEKARLTISEAQVVCVATLGMWKPAATNLVTSDTEALAEESHEACVAVRVDTGGCLVC